MYLYRISRSSSKRITLHVLLSSTAVNGFWFFPLYRYVRPGTEFRLDFCGCPPDLLYSSHTCWVICWSSVLDWQSIIGNCLQMPLFLDINRCWSEQVLRSFVNVPWHVLVTSANLFSHNMSYFLCIWRRIFSHSNIYTFKLKSQINEKFILNYRKLLTWYQTKRTEFHLHILLYLKHVGYWSFPWIVLNSQNQWYKKIKPLLK